MKTYAELDLKKIRDVCGLDFARHTYSNGQCSCCYGPWDMPAKYWAKGKKPKKTAMYDDKGKISGWCYDRPFSEITYILFKNANNGTGYIRNMAQFIEDYTCIEYRFANDEQKMQVCKMLQEQLGDEYDVQIPETNDMCIVLRIKKEETK